jgi:Heterokaryon incompatibility protein (HET)
MEVAVEPYVYEPLLTSSIRIIELLPGRESDSLECRLIHQTISGPPYEAISYCWGDPARAHPLRIQSPDTSGPQPQPQGQQILLVTANLSEALVAFRQCHQPRRLWADAVCINQEDVDEREAQVQMMGLIYSRATQVLGRLGPDFGGAEVAITTIVAFNQSPQAATDRVRAVLGDAESNHSEGDRQLLIRWRAIRDFFDLSYFHRVWIIQELGLAPHAQLSCGAYSIHWREVGTFVLWMDSQAADLIVQLRLKSWVVHHTDMIWKRGPDGITLKYNLPQVLHWARVHGATDARDRIFAFLSHPSACINGNSGKPLLRPSYRVSVEQAYVSCAATLIELTRSLHVLAFVDHDTKLAVGRLPSWAPDWHAPNLVSPLPHSYLEGWKQETDDGIAIDRTISGGSLRVRGLVIDDILTRSNMLERQDFPVTTLEKELLKTNPFCLDQLWRVCNSPRSSDLAVYEALDGIAISLSGEYCNDKPLSGLEDQDLARHRADFAAYIQAFEAIRPTEQRGGLFAELTDTVRREITARAEGGSAARFVQGVTWVGMCRVLFRTQRGMVGLGPRFLRPGDVVCRVAGSGLLLILRPVPAQSSDHSGRTYLLVGPGVLPGYRETPGDKSSVLEEMVIT